ncbi:MAG TPA: hypothetical protein VKR06_24635 [Ktedonosporobacter sp.]|nr:hypothetical protein [Ktedonosporobacter sp.]
MSWKQMVNWEQGSWEHAEAILSQVQDQMGHRIDAGILAPVVGLNLLGFHTTASCEGHLNWGCPYPWIEFYQEVNSPDYAQAVEAASRLDATSQERLEALGHANMLLARFLQQDPLYQALGALLADYTTTKAPAPKTGNTPCILFAPFAPGWYRLLAAEPSWWQRWEESERAENTSWWDRTPLQEQRQTLTHAQAEMATFAAFLKARWHAGTEREAVRV